MVVGANTNDDYNDPIAAPLGTSKSPGFVVRDKIEELSELVHHMSTIYEVQEQSFTTPEMIKRRKDPMRALYDAIIYFVDTVADFDRESKLITTSRALAILTTNKKEEYLIAQTTLTRLTKNCYPTSTLYHSMPKDILHRSRLLEATYFALSGFFQNTFKEDKQIANKARNIYRNADKSRKYEFDRFSPALELARASSLLLETIINYKTNEVEQ